MRVSGTSTGTPVDPTRAFRERARLEADRYGPDPWIFVRELLQNSRDAGARRVRFVVEQDDSRERVTCHDDGEGMTFEHARRYLFSLYASSKEGSKNQAGKFGVGFWSVLRFEPASIVIRSCPRDGADWGLRLDGSLATAVHVEPRNQPGTEISLERPRGDGRLEHRVFDAVWQSGRYLHHRDEPDLPVALDINGRSANADFALGAPSTIFRKRGLRGAVGLGPAPRVELFSRGLRVRAAACLEDLVAPAGRHTARMRVMFPELPGGLAPQALLESEHLELLLSRADARDNRALQKLVRLAQRELERLVDRQLAHARPQWFGRRALEAVRSALRASMLLRSLLGAAGGAAIALVIARVLWGFGGTTTPTPTPTDSAPPASEPVAVTETAPAPRPYRDLGARYRGPKVDVLSPASAEPVDLRYAPASERLYLTALSFSELATDGSPLHEAVATATADYTGTRCDDTCVEISLPFASDGGTTRIPVPTGHRVVDGSVTLDGHTLALRSNAEGQPLVVAEAPLAGDLHYRTAPAPDPSRTPVVHVRARLPGDLVRDAVRVRALPIAERVELLLTVVRRAVRYDHTPATAEHHTLLAKRGVGFIDRTLEIGAGDCDVQNSLLVALLHDAQVPARLAVGFVGAHGRAMPWLHAWVEYRGEDGTWRVADASDRLTAGVLLPRATTDDGGAGDDGPIAIAGTAEDDGAAPPEIAVAATPPSPNAATATAPAAPVSPPLADAAPGVIGTVDVADGGGGWRRAIRSYDARWPYVVRGIPVALLMLSLWLLFGTRMRRATQLDDSADLSRLLKGVLQQPGAFGHVAALFHRPLVPLCGGDSISLHRARELAARGRLYRTQQHSVLATRAIRSTAAVLDDNTGEGLTVADALGAVDLDRWSAMLARSQSDRMLGAVNDALRERGEDWCVRVADDIPGGMAVLELAPLGVRLPGTPASRLVLMDADDPVLARAAALDRRSPGAGVLLALDHVAARLGLADRRRDELLAEVAREALLEAFGR